MTAKEHGDAGQGLRASRFLGSLKDALVAAGRDDTGQNKAPPPLPAVVPPPLPSAAAAIPMPAPDKSSATEATEIVRRDQPAAPSAAEAAREVKGQTSLKAADRHVEFDSPPTTRVLRAAKPDKPADDAPARTQILRGRQQVARGAFHSDPVVAWLVVVGGPGLGSFRPVFEGNNTVGRAANQRVTLDFGDEAISHEEQAFIRYDSAERSFLFVPNLAKTNVVSVNNKRPTAAVELSAMDVITMGRTQLVFVPFCGQEFDWSEIAEAKD